MMDNERDQAFKGRSMLDMATLLARVEQKGSRGLTYAAQRERFRDIHPIPLGWLSRDETMRILHCSHHSLRDLPICRRPFRGWRGMYWVEAEVHAYLQAREAKRKKAT